jgi:chorismate dehydratase
VQNIRLGQIDFINCLPFNYALAKLLKQAGSKSAPLFLRLHSFELTKAAPARLNEMLFSGELDVAPISSIEYLRHREHYHLLDDIAISSKCEADSVLFLSTVDLASLRDVYVTDKSATSVALLRVILQEKYGLSGLNFIVASDLSDKPNKLLIGDEALVVSREGYQVVLDLGKEWNEFSGGLPMVFGLWAYRKDFDMQASLRRMFSQLKVDGLGIYFNEVVAEAARITGLSKERVREYFTHLDYDFSSQHEQSLALFEKHLAAVQS